MLAGTSTKPRSRTLWIEWGFMLFLGLLCACLTFLQYRWTGEVARAEAIRLRTTLKERLTLVSDSFNSQLNENCRALLPTAAELEQSGREEAHRMAWQRWQALEMRTPFARIGIVVPLSSGLQLFQLNQASGSLEEMAWPSSWGGLRDQFQSRVTGRGPGAPPFVDPDSTLIEFPVFGGHRPSAGPGREKEWMVFDLDTDLAVKQWLPGLTERFVNPGADPEYHIEVRLTSNPQQALYSTVPTEARTAWKPDATVGIFSTGLNLLEGRGHGPGPRGLPARWTLAAGYRPGAFDTVISNSRRRNLAIALLVNCLILAAGGALILHTRRSRQLAEAQMKFVATVSHELRTPLTVIRGAAHNLHRGIAGDPKKAGQYCELILQYSEQLGDLITQTLSIARVGSREGTATKTRLSIEGLLKEAVETTHLETQAAGCEIQLECSPNLPAALGDPSTLRRVFQNLVSNAAKHAGEGGWIGIKATPIQQDRRSWVSVVVSDRGPGIPKTEIRQIFEPFFRGSRAERLEIRGSGLGLSLVREIVDQHGGNVSVSSEPGKGSQFLIQLPAAPEDQP